MLHQLSKTNLGQGGEEETSSERIKLRISLQDQEMHEDTKKIYEDIDIRDECVCIVKSLLYKPYIRMSNSG